VRQPPNLLTPYKLARLRDDPALCRQALETSQLRYGHKLTAGFGRLPAAKHLAH
jgi:hypothetical protein